MMQEDFLTMCFPIYAYVKHVTLGAGPFLAPGYIILKNLVKVHQVMLHTKCQGSRPCGFTLEDYFMVLPI